MKISYIGLGKMGRGMVQRMLEKGYTIKAYDPDEGAREAVRANGAETVDTIENVLECGVPGSRTVWLMVPHQVVDSVLEAILPHLVAGDTVIDGGNSNYKETMRRVQMLAEHDVRMLDVGTSGGPDGARHGACMMVGGARADYDRYEALFRDMSAPEAYGYMGTYGAGHFVKMVHNGIEYGMMQAIAEGFAVMKASSFHINLTEVARVYNHKSVIASRLTQWLEDAYRAHGEDLRAISGEVSHSGEGLWTVQTAQELGVDVPIIAESLAFRERSHGNPNYTGQVVSALRGQFGGHPVTAKESKS